MKKLLPLFFFLFFVPLTVFAVQVSVPSAPSAGYFLAATSTGNWIATSTDPAHFGSLYATSTATSTFVGYISVAQLADFGLTSGNCVQAAAGGYLVSASNPCGSGGGGTDPFTHNSNYGVTMSASTTPFWMQGAPISFAASSTAVFANLRLGATTSPMILGLLNDGTVVATSTPTFASFSATSTATSTFKGGVNITGTDCFAQAGTCLQLLGNASTTDILYADANRTDSYTANGTIIYPYKSISALLTPTWTGAPAYAYTLAPGTYVDGAPDIFPNVPFSLYGNESTYIPVNGVTFPNSFDIYDLTIVGAVTESDTSLTNIHQFNNGVISSLGGLTIAGNATLSGETLANGTPLYEHYGALTDITGSVVLGAVQNYGGGMNFDNDFIDYASSTAYSITATSTGFFNGNFGATHIIGANVISTSTGGAINTDNGATSTSNFFANIGILTGVGAESLHSGNSATAFCSIQIQDIAGGMTWPNGTNWQNCYSGKAISLFGGGVGTTSPWGFFSIAATSSTNGLPLFVVSTSTATATSTAFQITSNGTASTSLLTISGLGNSTTNCLQVTAQGVVQATGSACGSGGGGGTDPFTHAQAGQSATTTAIGVGTTTPFFQLSVSTTSQSAVTTPLFGVASTSNANLFTVNGGGQIGIGTTTPYALVAINPTAGQLAVGTPALTIGSSSATTMSVTPYTTGDIVDWATTTSAYNSLVYSSSGNMGVASTTPQATVAIHALAGFVPTNDNLFLIGSSTNAATSTLFQVTNTGATFAPNTVTSGSNQTGYWCYDGSGQLIRDTTACLVSALKFKKDIATSTIGLTAVLQMQPVTYLLKQPLGKEDAGQQIGFIADWAEKIVPQLVTHDSNGDVHGFNYEQYTAVLTKGIQDFYAQFQALIARVSGLEQKVNEQQKEIDSLQAQINALKP